MFFTYISQNIISRQNFDSLRHQKNGKKTKTWFRNTYVLNFEYRDALLSLIIGDNPGKFKIDSTILTCPMLDKSHALQTDRV